MAYIVQADLLGDLTTAQLIQLTDDVQAGIVNTTVVTDEIAAGEAEVDSYLGVRHTVPLAAPVPVLVTRWTRTIVVYNLWGRRQRVPENVRQRYEDTIKVLALFAKGTLTLGVDPAPTAVTAAQPGEMFGPDRLFTRETLESF